MATRWTICWKCNLDIKTQVDCNYLKTRDGNLSFCPECYKQFLKHNIEFFRPDVSRQEEMERSLFQAMSDFHEKVMKKNDGKAPCSGNNNIPPVITHTGRWIRECDACIEIFNMRCSKQCPKKFYENEVD